MAKPSQSILCYFISTETTSNFLQMHSFLILSLRVYLHVYHNVPIFATLCFFWMSVHRNLQSGQIVVGVWGEDRFLETSIQDVNQVVFGVKTPFLGISYVRYGKLSIAQYCFQSENRRVCRCTNLSPPPLLQKKKNPVVEAKFFARASK